MHSNNGATLLRTSSPFRVVVFPGAGSAGMSTEGGVATALLSPTFALAVALAQTNRGWAIERRTVQ